MQYKPHKLFKLVNRPTEMDENGNFIPNENVCKCFLCNCFLHNVGTYEKKGYAGIGISVTFYINIEKRFDINVGDEVVVENEAGRVIGSGRVVDVKHTSGMTLGGMPEYTVVYI